MRDHAKAIKFEVDNKKKVMKKIEEVQKILVNKDKEGSEKKHHKHHKKSDDYQKAIKKIKDLADEPARAAEKATKEVEDKIKADEQKEKDKANE